jgi:hypothetical protein
MALGLDYALGNPGVNNYFANYEKAMDRFDAIPIEERVDEFLTFPPLEWARYLLPVI